MTNVFKINENKQPNLFFDGDVGIQRYDRIKYPKLEELYKKQRSFFWVPDEIRLVNDRMDFKDMTEAEQHIFTSNLKRQIVLDSVQGRAPTLCYGPIVSNPTMEKILNIWTFFETIHSESYTYIINNVYSDPSKIYDEMSEIKEIIECGNDVSVYYNKLLKTLRDYEYGHFEQKRAFYLSLVATNALEQIRFQVSFACTFAFGQRNKMEGSSRIIKLIRQDEAIHCGFTQNILKQIVKDDPEFEKIQESEKETVKEIYDTVLKQELEWIDYLFIKGPMFGLTQEELTKYLLWLASKRYKMMGIPFDREFASKDPLPWMSKWINTEDDQPPPQEEELTSYQLGTVDYNIADDAFKDFEI